MTLVQNSRSTESMGSTTNPTVAFVLQGAKQSTVGDQIYDYRAGQFLVVTVDLPMIGRVTEASEETPFVGIGLPLRPALIAELLLEGPAELRRVPARTAPGLAVNTADDNLLDAITRLLRLYRRPADYQVLAPGIIREIHWWLLTGSEQSVVRQLGDTESGTTLVAAAVRWIQQNVDQPLRVDALAADVGAGVSTLNRHFRAVTRLSPLQYQKALRLQRARLALLSTRTEVARIGHEVGYQSLSQFSREYRRMFGVPPSADRAGSLDAAEPLN
ncbi:AraC family transcriptional regulator [Kribbella antibiotica]|uniref:AraC family transcriptional regulator n=2 Tax=Kribbella antibiotica TaxID=190195 RepID=A0A4R4YTK4_9ACTN|nr:AraC family transcriptional regulator [Kribbella antibiotica]